MKTGAAIVRTIIVNRGIKTLPKTEIDKQCHGISTRTTRKGLSEKSKKIRLKRRFVEAITILFGKIRLKYYDNFLS
jgi:hypothetical protein